MVVTDTFIGILGLINKSIIYNIKYLIDIMDLPIRENSEINYLIWLDSHTTI